MQTQNRATYTGCDVLKLLSNFGVLLKNNTGNILVATIRMKKLKRFFSLMKGLLAQTHHKITMDQTHHKITMDQTHHKITMDQTHHKITMDQTHHKITVHTSMPNRQINRVDPAKTEDFVFVRGTVVHPPLSSVIKCHHGYEHCKCHTPRQHFPR